MQRPDTATPADTPRQADTPTNSSDSPDVPDETFDPGPVPSDLPKADLTDNARTVLAKRYLRKSEDLEPIEEPEEMFWRVARVIAEMDARYGASEEEVVETAREFYRMMAAGEFEPNSPTLMNAGRPLGQLSACFVLPVPDSLEGIYETLRDMALIHQSGGGTGFGFSRLRPQGDVVKSTMGVASGPVSFMEVYDASTEAVKQGGCVVPDTLVSTDRGFMPIRELGPEDAEADTWHGHAAPLRVSTDAGPRDSDEFYNHGTGPVRTIRTKAGYQITTTPQHKLRVIDAEGGYVWRRMDELQVGGWVAMQKGHLMEPSDYSLPAFEGESHFNATDVRLPEETSEPFGEFLGYLVGDGSFNRYNLSGKTGRLIFTVADSQPEVAEWLVATAEELFGLTPIANKKPDDGSTNYYFNSTVLVDWLEQLGVTKPSAAEATVPDLVFRKGLATARGFLRGLFTADGSVTDEGYPSLSSVSDELIEGVQQLLLAVGVPSATSVRDDGVFSLRVASQAGRDVFAGTIGFLAEGDGTLEPAGFENTSDEIIPNQSVDQYLPGTAAPETLTRSRLATLAEKHAEIRTSPLMWFLANDQYYDQIESIEDGESLTLDLSVPENNTYVANGFVSHNTRRGANMGILRVDHPDILHFIHCKSDKNKITNFNISVAITDDFMDAVERGAEYDLLSPRTGEPVGQLDAREVFDKIVYGAWRNGEPGAFFIDEANRHNPVPHIGMYEATNPCGEQVLLPYDVCNLGSVNVGKYVDGETKTIDWDGMRTAVHKATHFLDNVIDANRYPLPEIEELSNKIRRVGLGLMGWADMLVKLGEPYGSPRSIELGREVMRFIDEEAKVESERLARERGVFPAWEGSVWGPDDTAARDSQGARIRPMRRLRNCNVTTVAPTGTISIIAGCSSGIEPLFAVAFMRNQAGSLMPDVNPEFVRIAKEQGWYSEELMERIANEGHIHFDEIPEDVQSVFTTAHDVTPEQHIRMQAAFQEHNDSGISKTCNFPESATEDDVREIFELAFQLNCKGVTVYRDGSRDAQVLSTGKTAQKVTAEVGEDVKEAIESGSFEKVGDQEMAEAMAAALAQIEELEQENEEAKERIAALEGGMMRKPEKRSRPSELRGVTRKIESPLGDMYVTINEDEDGRPFEVFVALGKAGGPAMADAEAIGRLISLALRSGISLRQVHKQLRGISSDRAVGFGPNKILSSPDAIAQVIEKHLEEKEGIQQSLPMPDPGAGKVKNGGNQTAAGTPAIHRFEEHAALTFIGTCPDCGSGLEFAEGCAKCHACGYSECG